jgi:hypothetical protein
MGAARLIDSTLASLLGQWTQFESLDAAALRLFNMPDPKTFWSVSGTFSGSSRTATRLERFLKYARERRLNSLIRSERFLRAKAKLAELAEAGFIISDTELLSRCRQHSTPEGERPRIVTLGVPTRNRPESLRECLFSFMENAKCHGRTINIAVTDDSDAPEARSRNREVLATIQRHYGVKTFYAGREEKSRFVRLLEYAGLPRDVVEFALFGVEGCGPSTGRNRNALLLHTVGDVILTSDDDCVCRPIAHPQLKHMVTVMAHEDPTHLWFFNDREEALRFAPPDEVDVFAIHESQLGRKIAEVVCEHAAKSGARLIQPCPDVLKSMEDGNGRIVATFTGGLGDCGMYSAAGLLVETEPRTRERLVSSKRAYDLAVRTGEVLRVAPSPTICHGPPFMGAFLALDNRRLLPPFMPVERNEDGVFGSTILRCFTGSYFAHLPWALLHTGAESRSYLCHYLDTADHVRLCDILTACLFSYVLHPATRDYADSIKELGRFLMELRSMKPSEFEKYVRIRVLHRVTQEISYRETLLDRYHGEPRFWADDVRAWVERRRQFALGCQCTVASDLLHGRSLDEARELTQRLVAQFGELLVWWPDIVRVAKELRDRGQRLGVDVYP